AHDQHNYFFLKMSPFEADHFTVLEVIILVIAYRMGMVFATEPQVSYEKIDHCLRYRAVLTVQNNTLLTQHN
ncbi:MAG: hypothetical protein NTU49_01085, partial [Gammaproteobacteria bacterium]|nr:hypothetical protein [Gammaproteobacteria bacterium]